MLKSRFDDLCWDIGVALEESNPEEVARHGAITIQGVNIQLRLEETNMEPTIIGHVDMGIELNDDALESKRRLMALNLACGSKRHGFYAIDPGTGKATMIIHFDASHDLNGQEMATTLVFRAAQAKAAAELIS
jgi:hypothetical protein